MRTRGLDFGGLQPLDPILKYNYFSENLTQFQYETSNLENSANGPGLDGDENLGYSNTLGIPTDWLVISSLLFPLKCSFMEYFPASV